MKITEFFKNIYKYEELLRDRNIQSEYINIFFIFKMIKFLIIYFIDFLHKDEFKLNNDEKL